MNRTIITLTVFLVAGCLTPFEQDTTSGTGEKFSLPPHPKQPFPPGECFRHLCNVEPGDPEAALIRERYGLTEILRPENQGPMWLERINHGLTTWRRGYQNQLEESYAYDLNTHALHVVSIYNKTMTVGVAQILDDSLLLSVTNLPIDSTPTTKGRGVSKQFAQLKLSTGDVRLLNVSPLEHEDGIGMEYPWYVNSRSDWQKALGIWATNLIDGQSHHILNFTRDELGQTILFRNTLYYTKGIQGVRSYNLYTGEEKAYPFKCNLSVELGAGRNVLVQSHETPDCTARWLLDPETGVYSELPTPNLPTRCVWQQGFNDLLLVTCSGSDYARECVVYNTTTGKEFRVGGSGFDIDTCRTDGRFLVVSATPFGLDVANRHYGRGYYMDLPQV